MSTRRRNSGHHSPADADYDVPFFTVAHYKSPTATPTTYEFAAPPVQIPPSNNYKGVQSPRSAHGTPPQNITLHGFSPRSVENVLHGEHSNIPPSIPSYSADSRNQPSMHNFADSRDDQGIQGFCGEGAGEALCSDSLEPNISPVRLAFGPSLPGESWWPPDDIISPSEVSPVSPYQLPSQPGCRPTSYEDSTRRSRGRERTPVDTIHEAPLQEQSSSPVDNDEVPVKQAVIFTISPPSRPKSRKKTPEPPGQRSKPTTPNGSVGGHSGLSRATKVYEDASVSDAGEQLFPSSQENVNHDKKQVEDRPQSLSRSSSMKRVKICDGSVKEADNGFAGERRNSGILRGTFGCDNNISLAGRSVEDISESLSKENYNQYKLTSVEPIPGELLSLHVEISTCREPNLEFNDKIEKESPPETNLTTEISGKEVHRQTNIPDASKYPDGCAEQQRQQGVQPVPTKTKPHIPPKPTPEQIESASRRNSMVDPQPFDPQGRWQKEPSVIPIVENISVLVDSFSSSVNGEGSRKTSCQQPVTERKQENCSRKTQEKEVTDAVASGPRERDDQNHELQKQYREKKLREGNQEPKETINLTLAVNLLQEETRQEKSPSRRKTECLELRNLKQNENTKSGRSADVCDHPKSNASRKIDVKTSVSTSRKPLVDPPSKKTIDCASKRKNEGPCSQRSSESTSSVKASHDNSGSRGGSAENNAKKPSLENQTRCSTADVTPRTPRTPRSKSREPSFCLELDYGEFPVSDTEYLAMMHAKIAEAHERQLLPLKEDVADWLAKLLSEDGLTHLNLIERLGTGVLLCHLADIVSKRAQDARQMGLSDLDVPRLPYKTWERARPGSFFARDNISNFLRFCRRLRVHDNLLFETEDLVSGNCARTIVLCLLEVGRLAQKWWGLEPPAIVKLEREMDGEEWSARSDSGYSNASSPRGSTLALHPSAHSPPAPSAETPKASRPRSAPCHLPLVARLSLPSSAPEGGNDAGNDTTNGSFCFDALDGSSGYPEGRNNANGFTNTDPDAGSFKIPLPCGVSTPTRPKTGGGPSRSPKPTPPPKPASVKKGVYGIATRPVSLPSNSNTPGGWSGSKTTPCTPVTTPTHTPRSRLPIARTPRTSGRSTPNTTPTTPTQSRRYISSVSKNHQPRTPSSSRIPCRTPTTSTFNSPRQSAAFVTPTHGGRPPPSTPSSARTHCIRAKEDKQQLNKDLDNRVAAIARQTRGVCSCSDPACSRQHIKRLSDGKYDVYGKSVYVRLLKDKHVMVRVGGGWDTLEHYVLSHDPTQVTMFNSRGTDPFLHIRSHYRSPAPNRNLSKSVQQLCKKNAITPKAPRINSSSNGEILAQPDFDTSFGSSQSLSDGSSSHSELTESGDRPRNISPQSTRLEESKLISAIESLSQSIASTSGESSTLARTMSPNNDETLMLTPLEESPTDNNNGAHGGDFKDGNAVAEEDLLSPCPCEVVPPMGAITTSCPPDVLAVSLTDSCHSQSISLASNTESGTSNSAVTVINTPASLSDSVSSSTLLDEANNAKMADSCDSISSMERSQDMTDVIS